MAAAAPLLAVARRISGPTLFFPGGVEPSNLPAGLGVDKIAEAIRLAAGPGRLRLYIGRCFYPDLDPFEAINVRDAEGAWQCAFADRWADIAALRETLRAIEAAL